MYPFLFLLVVDVLSPIVIREVDGSILEPFKVASNEVALSHLQFVDNTMLFFVMAKRSPFLS